MNFGDWMEEQASRQDTDGPLRMFRDLASLCALLFEGSQRPITDRVEGRRRAALAACKEFQDKYD